MLENSLQLTLSLTLALTIKTPVALPHNLYQRASELWNSNSVGLSSLSTIRVLGSADGRLPLESYRNKTRESQLHR